MINLGSSTLAGAMSKRRRGRMDRFPLLAVHYRNATPDVDSSSSGCVCGVAWGEFFIARFFSLFVLLEVDVQWAPGSGALFNKPTTTTPATNGANDGMERERNGGRREEDEGANAARDG